MHEQLIPLVVLPAFFLVAFLYSSVGHGGASGYLALFAILGIATPGIVPIALVLNIVVAVTGFLQYRRRGHFSFSMLLPFIAGSIPAAYIGGLIAVPQIVFSLMLGIALLLAAARLVFMRGIGPQDVRALPQRTLWAYGLPIGIGLGLLSGMIGIGGGVFLSPILLLAKWADTKRTAAISSAFIVLNSLAGLAGQVSRIRVDVLDIVPLAVVVATGGYIGSQTGAGTMSPKMLQKLLAVVLLLAGGKLLAAAVL